MLTIGRWGLRVPEGTDGPADVPARMLQLATDLSDVAKDNQGTFAARPPSTALAPTNKPGGYYVSTNEEDPTGTTRRRVYRDHGAGYDELAVLPVSRRMIDLAALHWADTFANRAPGLLGQSGSVPAEGTMFTATDKGPMTWQVISGAWVLLHAVAQEVTSLPASPVVGQECMYIAENATSRLARWHLRYSVGPSSTFLWAFLGGAPMRNENATSGTTTSTAYDDLGVGATAGPDLTVPLAGRYHVRFGAHLDLQTVTGINQGRMSLAIGATAGDDTRSAIIQAPGASPGTRIHGTPSWSHEWTIAAGTLIRGKYRTTNASNDMVAVNRWLELAPLFISP